MDIPAKVIFRWENHYQKFEKEAQLFMHNHLGFSGVSIKEFESISIYFESKDKDAVLEVERFDQNKPFIIKSGEQKLLTEGGDHENMLVPGYYPLILKTKNTSYKSLYRIIPRNISWDELKNLRKYLEKILSGLSQNLLNKKVGSQVVEEMDKYSILMEMYELFLEHYSPLRKNLEDILKKPLEKYKRRNYYIQAKEHMKKKAIFTGKRPGKLTAEVSYNTHENRYLKQSVLFLQYVLRKIERLFKENYLFIKKAYTNKKQEIDIEEANFLDAKNKWFISVNEKRRKENLTSLKDLETKLEESYKDWQNVRRIYIDLLRHDHNSWLRDINAEKSYKEPTLTMLKDRRYAEVYRLTKDLKKVFLKEKKESNIYFPSKPTSVLFEYYVFCALVSILEKEGFEWYKGWLVDKDNPLLSSRGTLPPGTILRFRKRGFFIELSYDLAMKDLKTKNDSYFVPGRSKRPDYRIDLYNHNGLLIKTLVLDAKYRRFKYLYTQTADTDVMEQLKDYLDLKYYCKERDELIHIVDKVIAVYPKDEREQTIQHKFHDKIIFSQLNPNDPDSNEEPYGFFQLQNEIRKFLDAFIEKNDIY